MPNVGMNIADKQTLYGEIARVLKPGGRFVFQEMAAGKIATPYFPLPWATDPTDNSLVSADEISLFSPDADLSPSCSRKPAIRTWAESPECV